MHNLGVCVGGGGVQMRCIMANVEVAYRAFSSTWPVCKFIGTKEIVGIRKEFNSHRTGLGHRHGRHFIVLGHYYGCGIMWKHLFRMWMVHVVTFSRTILERSENQDSSNQARLQSGYSPRDICQFFKKNAPPCEDNTEIIRCCTKVKTDCKKINL